MVGGMGHPNAAWALGLWGAALGPHQPATPQPEGGRQHFCSVSTHRWILSIMFWVHGGVPTEHPAWLGLLSPAESWCPAQE